MQHWKSGSNGRWPIAFVAIALAGIFLGASVGAPTVAAGPSPNPLPDTVFDGGNGNWGLRVEAESTMAVNATYYTFVPQLFGIVTGQLTRQPVSAGSNQIVYKGNIRTNGRRVRTYTVKFAPTPDDQPCLDDNLREYSYAVIASLDGIATWTGCGEFGSE